MAIKIEKVHEHIIRISSKEQHLTREQIFAGMIDLMRNPKEYLPHLEDVHCEELRMADGSIVFHRSLDFGPYCVDDKVVVTPDQNLFIHIPETGAIPESLLSVGIEEPTQGDIFLRFEYCEDPEKSPVKGFPEGASIRKQAWEAKDQEFSRLIVEKAANGAFCTRQ